MSKWHKIKVSVGDRWNDGHGQYVSYIYKVNVTPEELGRLDVESSKLTGINFAELCEDYQQYSIDEGDMEKLYDAGISRDFYDVHSDNYGDLWFEFCKLSNSNLKWKSVNDEFPEFELGGYGFF